jgi:diguanylate cyclase (GGDEF)-like protein
MLARLPLRQLFWAVCAVFAAPILLLAWLFYDAQQSEIALSEKERAGVAYLGQVWPALASAAKGEALALDPIISAGDIHNSIMRAWGPWRAFRLAAENGQDTGAVLETGVSLIRAVGDGSNLILDPELNSYYLMDAVVIRLPVVMKELGVLGARQSPGALAGEIARDVESIAAAYDAAFRNDANGGVSSALATPYLRAIGSLESVVVALKALGASAPHKRGHAAKLAALETARRNAIAAVDALYAPTLAELDRLLRGRTGGVQTALWINLSVAGLVALLALLMAAFSAARITRVFTELAQRLYALSSGDTGIDIPYRHYSNEIGLIARSLSVFRDHALERLRLAEEITQAQRLRERDLERVAFYDDLTGLPNRKHLYRAFSHFLKHRGDAARGAIIYVDLDRFKEINDTLGHQVGDALIRTAAQRLSAMARPGDVIARISGDEFALLLDEVCDGDLVQVFGAAVLQRLSEPYEIDGGMQHLTASLGVALIAPNLAHDPDELLRRADVALYRAKERGRNCCVLFDSVFDAEVLYRKRIEGALRDAIDQDQIRLAFQPQFSTDGRRIVGVEALARWEDAKLGQISPGVFIPIAEHSGLIVELGRSILRQAMQHAKRWPDLTVAVNLSVLQLRQKGFLEMLATCALDAGVSADRIELELTESILLEDVDEVNAKLREVKALGYRLALDDFGTGYSSLSYLTRFAFDKLKIDRSFVQNLENSPHARTVMRSIAALGRAVGLEVCAEGVETESQFDVVCDVGCTSVQGYLFMPPVAASEIDRLLQRGPAPAEFRRAVAQG